MNKDDKLKYLEKYTSGKSSKNKSSTIRYNQSNIKIIEDNDLISSGGVIATNKLENVNSNSNFKGKMSLR